MEAVEHPRSVLHAEYRPLLLEELDRHPGRWKTAGAGSLAFHVVFVLALLIIPSGPSENREPERLPRRVTPLVDPPTRLTQKAPNRKPLSQEISVGMLAPSVRPEKQTPVPHRKSSPGPQEVARKKTPTPAIPQEPPKIASQSASQMVQIAPPIAPPPATVQQPKLVLEAPPPPPPSGNGSGVIKTPGGGIQEAVRELAHAGGGSRTVGDDVTDSFSSSLNTTPSPTRPKSSLELLSDPKGVDFRPYLLQVLQAVRRNWFAVMPESVRLGQKGRVVLQFAIAKNGKITKVVFSTESGARALDRAAVAALSASDPLLPLPPEFTGDRVVLQFTFLYNAPR